MAEGALSARTGPYRDVIIVGGGPAGAAAAICCASAGLDVVLVESARRGRARKAGETLHPGIEAVLRVLGVADDLAGADFPRHLGHWVEWAGPAYFQDFGTDAGRAWRGYQADRRVFDEMLLDRARRDGAQIWQPCTALGALVNQERVNGVVTSLGTVLARTVIDASGRRNWLARQLKMPLAPLSPRLVAAFGYRSGSCPDRDDAPMLRADEHGWTWMARVGPATYAWVRLPLDSAQPWGQVPQEFSHLVPRSRPRGANVTWRMAAAPAGPGYMLVGDASAVLDPAASHGVLKALMSGVIAARATANVLHGHAGENEAATAYRRWTTGWFRNDMERLDSQYQIFPSWRRARSQSPH